MARTFTSTGYIEVPSNAAMDGADLSVSVFIKPTSLISGCEYVGRHSASNSVGGWGMGMDSAGAVGCYSKSTGAFGGAFNSYSGSAGNLTANQWNHVGLSISQPISTPWQLYCQGALINSGTSGYAWDYNGALPFRIGDSTDGFWTNMTGDIAEVAWWNQRLTADEYAALGKGVPASAIRPAALVLYMPLRN